LFLFVCLFLSLSLLVAENLDLMAGTLIDIVSRAARQDPDEVAIVEDDGHHSKSLTYAQLIKQMMSISEFLLEHIVSRFEASSC
jgi:hypothetical protein